MNGVSPPTLASRSPSTTRDHDTRIHMRDGWCKHNNLGGWVEPKMNSFENIHLFLMENYCLDPKQMTRLHKTKPSFLPTMMICGFPARKKVESKLIKGSSSLQRPEIRQEHPSGYDEKYIHNGCQRRYPGGVGRFLFTHTPNSCLALHEVYVYYTTTFYRKNPR